MYKKNNINFEDENLNFKSIVIKTLGFTYLNPHVYSDTVFFLGNFSKNFIFSDKILFGVGASLASFSFFFLIGYLSKYLSHYAKSEQVKGEGDKKATEIYSSSYSKDPDFYEFMKTLETYEQIIDEKTIIFLPMNSSLLDLLQKRN